MTHRFHSWLPVALGCALLTLAAAPVAAPAVASGPDQHGSIVYTRQLDAGGSDVFVVRPGGTDDHQLGIPFTGEDFNRSVWSHRGRSLLYSNIPFTDPGTGTFVGFRPATSRPDGSGFHLLALPDRGEDMYCTAWTPDDRRIVCGDDTPGLFSMRASDGGDVRRLTHNPYAGQDIAVGFSPDGRRLAFLRQRPGSAEADDGVALFLARPDGSHVRQLTPFGLLFSFTELAGASWSPDGRHLISSTGDGDLVVVRADGRGTPRTVSISVDGTKGFAALPDYAPNGRRMVFSLFLDAPADLYTADLDGTHVRRLTTSPVSDINADWGRSHDTQH